MSTTLHLRNDEYDQMIARGAFDHLDRRIELIRGELREMSPAGPYHDDLIDFLITWSYRSGVPYNIRGQSGLDLPELGSRPEPDVLWVKKRRYSERHPGWQDVFLVIEVSMSSRPFDLGEKSVLYAEAGIIEYWGVDAEQSLVHILSKPTGTSFQSHDTFGIGDTISPQCTREATLDLAELFRAKPSR